MDQKGRGKIQEILRSRQPPGGICRNMEAFKSHVDGSIVTNQAERREHNRRNDVIDVREWGNDSFCNLDAKKEREAHYLGTSVKERNSRQASIRESINKLEQGYKPHLQEQE